MIPHFVSGDTVTVYVPAPKTIDSTHPNFSVVLDRLKDPNHTAEEMIELMDLPTAIRSKLKVGNVEVAEDCILYKGTPLEGYFVGRILEHMRAGFQVEPMVAALDQLMENPSYRIREQLVRFLEAAHIPFQSDGRFLVFKRVRDNYHDIHTGRFSNHVGAVVEMDRTMVDDDPNRTCSAGLHVCSYNYLPYFGSMSNDRVVICAVSPKDVVSVPTDYDNAKMRVCKYEVVGELPADEDPKAFFTDYVDDRFMADDDEDDEIVGVDLDGDDVYLSEVDEGLVEMVGIDRLGNDLYRRVW